MTVNPNRIRNKRVRNLGIGLLIIALILGVTLAAPHILKATQLQQNSTCTDMLVCTNFTVNYSGKPSTGSTEILLSNADITLSSKDAFYINNPVYYDITVNDPNRSTEKVYFLITPSNYNFSKLQYKSLDEVLEISKKDQTLVNLSKISDTQYHSKKGGYVAYSDTVGVDVQALLVFHDNKTFVTTPITNTTITLDSQKIGSDAVQSHALTITNENILGLTYLGLALAPALLGADMILRVIFEGKSS